MLKRNSLGQFKKLNEDDNVFYPEENYRVPEKKGRDVLGNFSWYSLLISLFFFVFAFFNTARIKNYIQNLTSSFPEMCEKDCEGCNFNNCWRKCSCSACYDCLNFYSMWNPHQP
jgi:hypothetical protein